jgi:MoaA/NifB/PqqE/SkfB family radical SAM enzyme
VTELILDGHKLAWHAERVRALLAGERVAPITIDCALTRRCTYRCVYCYGQLQANREYPLDLAVIQNFLDDAAEIGVKAVSFVSDGESTCHPDLVRAVLHGRAAGLDMALGTNGYLLDPGELPRLLPALTYLRFNISAGEPARYAAVHGVAEKCFHKVRASIRRAVAVKAALGLSVTIGLQMVLLPAFADQIMPLARLGRELGVDYLVIKHCSDDERHSLGVDYDAYEGLVPLLRQAEALSAPGYLVRAKWSKLLSGGGRTYRRCLGPPLILQMSGSGLVAPCGMLFGERYAEYHIGNITQTRFRDLWKSERYWEVMNRIASSRFDATTMCGSLCLQHKVNECLDGLAAGTANLPPAGGEPPPHVNFI